MQIDLNYIKKSFLELGIVLELRLLDECQSTMSYAKLHPFLSDGIVISKKQTEGRGRNNKTFLSNEGGLYMTLVLSRTNLSNKYPLIAALAVCKALGHYNIKSFIKWPNDILIENKKVCGILTVADFAKQQIHIGFGVNVSGDISEIKDIATRLDLIKKDIRIEELTVRIIDIFFTLEKMDFPEFLSIYKQNCITILSGKAFGLDNDGYLLVENNGKVERVVNPME